MVKRLNLRREPEWVDMRAGLRVLIRPMRPMDMLRIAAKCDLSVISSASPSRDPEEPARLRARRAVAVVELASAAIVDLAADWTARDAETGDPVPLEVDEVQNFLAGNTEGVERLIVWLFAGAADAEALEREKNVSAPSLNGSSAGAPTTAPPAKASAPNAPRKSTSRRRSKAATSGG